MVKGLRDKYKEAKKRRKTRQEKKCILSSKLLRRNKFQSYAAGAIRYSRQRVLGEISKNISFYPKDSRVSECCESLFFQKDDYSRLAGKRKTVPRFKVKKQKKCLNVDIKETAFVLNTEIYNVRQTN